MLRHLFSVLSISAILALPPAAPAQEAIEHQEMMRYDGHKVVSVNIRNLRDWRLMEMLSPDMWSCHGWIGGPVEFRIPPESWEALTQSDLEFEIVIEDVQPLVEATFAGGPLDDWYSAYRDFDTVMGRLDEAAARRPDLARVVSIGDSLEEREIRAIVITAPGGGEKPQVVYHGGQHAREWITIMATMFFIEYLIDGYGVDPVVTDLVNRVEFHLIPVMNPDGYIWSWTNERMWRKNRRGDASSVWGVDLNRNWGVGWGGGGSSNRRSSQIYRGTAPFSEPETQVMRDLMRSLPNLRAHQDIHNYSQMVMSPWGYTDVLPPDHAVLQESNIRQAYAMMALYNTPYTYGPVYTTIYQASGVSCDWSYGELGVLGHTYELRPRGANPGFLLPPDQIVPASEECVVGLVALSQYVLELEGGIGLYVVGECGVPNGGRIEWYGAMLNTTLGLIFASNTGSFIIPTGNPCAGTTLGLGSSQIQLAHQFPSGNGSGSLNVTFPTAACGGYLQMIEVPFCATSNVAPIPQ